MERLRIASRVGKSLQYHKELIDELLKAKKEKLQPQALKHQNQEPFQQDTSWFGEGGYVADVCICAGTSHLALLLFHGLWLLLSCLAPLLLLLHSLLCLLLGGLTQSILQSGCVSTCLLPNWNLQLLVWDSWPMWEQGRTNLCKRVSPSAWALSHSCRSCPLSSTPVPCWGFREH